MGPVTFRPEGKLSIGGHQFCFVLQWGQSFSDRKTLVRLEVSQNGNPASMEPIIFRTADAKHKSKKSTEPTLQWGRSFSDRKTVSHEFLPSTEPRLQWGRSFSDRKT